MKTNSRKAARLLVTVIIAVSVLTPNASVQAQRDERTLLEPEYAAGELIIEFKEATEPSADFQKKYQIDSVKKLSKRQFFLLKTKHQGNLKKLAQLISKETSVEYAEPNYIVHAQVFPDDPKFSQQWGLHNSGQTGGFVGADVDAPAAWDTTHDSNIVVGIIDSGIEYNHPDLVENIWKNPGEIASNNLDDDGNGYVDDVYGWDFANNDNNPYDDNGHGTHVAGIIGASGNNGVGIAGVAWNIKLAGIKFLNSSGSGTTAAAVQAIEYANLMGFKVTNNSWGGAPYSQALYDAVAATHAAGNLFVAAAGNSGRDTDFSPAYPASYDLPNIISVASTDSSDSKAANSNYGQISVDLGAPGVNIYSTVPIPGCVLCDWTGYKTLSGTSMAAPHVAGFAALLWSRDPEASNLAVKNTILSTTDPLNSLEGKTVTGGRLNVYNIFDSSDIIAPSPILDLSVQSATNNSATLRFTAVGDDAADGQAKLYDIRYSSIPIDNENFGSAVQAANEPKPAGAGILETVKVTGLDPDTAYYFAVKVSDNVRNVSEISNVVSAATLPTSVVFSDNMESDTVVWTNTGNTYPLLWHKSYRKSYSPSRAWYYGKDSDGTYDTGFANYGVITSPVIDLRAVANAELRFQHFLATENVASYDLARVQIMNADGSNLATLLTKTSTNGAWVQERLDISPYDGKEVRVKFYFDTIDSVSNRFEGWYVDDVEVFGAVTNEKPIANAGPDVTAQVYQNILFDGSLSHDPDGSISSYLWNFGDGTTASGNQASHTFSSPGTYTVILSVTDNAGLTATDSAIATISSASPITVFSDSFEIGEWNGLWTEDAQNDWSRTNSRQLNGTYSAQVKGAASDAQLLSVPIDLQGRVRATVTFAWFNSNALDTGEYIAFDISTDGGTAWIEKARLRGDVDPENVWRNVTVEVADASQLKLRYRGRMSQPNETANLDLVQVNAW